ncbi:MAG: hypothetical protein ABL921_03890 [Pirellula sp.]
MSCSTNTRSAWLFVLPLTLFVLWIGGAMLQAIDSTNEINELTSNVQTQQLVPAVAPAKSAEAPPSQPGIVVWETPANNKPKWLTREQDSELSGKMEDAIRDRLNKRIEVKFNAQPLSSALRYFSEELKIPILIDDKALQDESISPDEPVTLDFGSNTTMAKSSLNLILEPLQLTYIIRNEIMIITSRQTSANIVRYYDLSFVLPDNSTCHELNQLIETIVAPDLWQVAGGTCSKTIFGSMLVVSAPEVVQDAVEELLRNVATQPKKNMKPQRPVPNSKNHGTGGFPAQAPNPAGGAAGGGGMM